MRNKPVVERDTYNGHDMLVIKDGPDDKFPVKFGRRKALYIAAAAKEVLEFAAESQLLLLKREVEAKAQKTQAKPRSKGKKKEALKT